MKWNSFDNMRRINKHTAVSAQNLAEKYFSEAKQSSLEQFVYVSAWDKMIRRACHGFIFGVFGWMWWMSFVNYFAKETRQNMIRMMTGRHYPNSFCEMNNWRETNLRVYLGWFGLCLVQRFTPKCFIRMIEHFTSAAGKEDTISASTRQDETTYFWLKPLL